MSIHNPTRNHWSQLLTIGLVFTVAEPLNALTGWSAKQYGPSRGTALLVVLIRLCRQKRFKS